MLKSKEYAAIKSDYDAVSREYFPNSYFWPNDMSFANSDALCPAAPLTAGAQAGIRGAMQATLLRHLPLVGAGARVNR
jgi:hypothetical protein